uniref:histidine kinase n=1 Tax=Chromera velia CCMP2878 TaxID=1169474 RepID=A0A0G4IBD6_9ALVE|eukprot:Cvel_12813.t1-p1 / transcript=Cvel_12813.t1 / gene=Cvel_12813 / organism=Chromera_velia_CCMP2878 / gene_product=Ethylene receptor, putative / transcript_product=Ethylene receptor, putative / location=Cvel_scaffold854:12314-14260(+) / protein_length=649 / sequence_SO=supercontig / SO=protein_coding / is_pseudo=false
MTAGLWNKAILIPLHFSNFHYGVLVFSDALVWLIVAAQFLGSAVPVVLFLVAGQICSVSVSMGLRYLATQTLAAFIKQSHATETAELALKRFISYIMHEMRNPLSGASLLVSELRDLLTEVLKAHREKGGEREKETTLVPQIYWRDELLQMGSLLELLSTQLGKMTGVCNDVLQLERLERGAMEFVFLPRPIREWLQHVAKQAERTFAASVGVSFHWVWEEFEEDGEGKEGNGQQQQKKQLKGMLKDHPRGVADFVRLEQVIDNFLGNGLKFTPSGGSVCLRARLRLPSPEEIAEVREESLTEGRRVEGQLKAWKASVRDLIPSKRRGSFMNQDLHSDTPPSWVVLRVCVEDTGAGLSESDLPRLFRPYVQIRAGELQNGGGTGLGLCICKSFVEAHAGGRIWAQSAGEGKGSSFIFEICLPLAPPDPFSPSTPESPPASSAPVRTSVHRSKSAPPRRESVCTPSSPSESPLSRDTSHSPEMAALGSQKTKRAEKIHKKAQGKAYLQNLSADSGARKAEVPQSPSHQHTKTPADDKKRENEAKRVDVLVADDDRLCLLAASAVIRHLGFSLQTAEDGQSAIDLVCNRGTEISPRCEHGMILIDNNMPGLSGPETVAKMRAEFEAMRSAREEGGRRNRSGGKEGKRSAVC